MSVSNCWHSVNLAFVLLVCIPIVTAWTPPRAHFLGADHNSTHLTQFVKASRLKCGITIQVNSHSQKDESCPEECPFYAQDLADELHCSFICVSASECASKNSNRPIADFVNGHKICRGPVVTDCEIFHLDGTDTCKKCQLGYAVGSDKLCYFQYFYTVLLIAVVFIVFGIFLLMWVIDCCTRSLTNMRGLKQGEKFRSLQKIRTPIIPGKHDKMDLYPLTTNLTKEDVAGPGMLLHFRFQAMLIVWALIIAGIWFCFALFIDDDLFRIGTRSFGTPRENCILVAWGYETQQRLMWTKVWFLTITYLFTFVLTIAHAIRQYQIFEQMDSGRKTMKDFVAALTNVPVLDGKAETNAEDRLKMAVANFVGADLPVVGVSIAWNYKENVDLIEQCLEEDLVEREKVFLGADFHGPQPGLDYACSLSPIRRRFYELEQWATKKVCGGDTLDTSQIKKVLMDLKTASTAYVVFETEADRDEAVSRALKSKGIEFEGVTMDLVEDVCEPDTVLWVNCGNTSFGERLFRLVQGFGCIFGALLLWTAIFYAPYAWQVYTFNFSNGAQPPLMLATTFTMVVVAGNAIMYDVCARVSDYIGFKTRDDRESCYLILYVIACLFAFLLDLVTTYFMSVQIIDGLGFRTYEGVNFSNVDNFSEQFETYAMQRLLAENTKAYAWPSTFLIPFLLEPFVTIIAPYKLGQLMVATHPEWVNRDAEKWMQAWEFDMGRYGDLLFDMVLCILIFFFPGGYTILLFVSMAGSHMYIYAYDHARVLGTIPKCVYARIDVDWWANWMMAPITGLIAMCVVFKANCHYGFCLEGIQLIEVLWVVFTIHTAIHTLLLVFLVPFFRPSHVQDENSEVKYSEMASRVPRSWFSSNPIHCLRSKLIKEDSPPCIYSFLGKEHLQKTNTAIGCFFEHEQGEGEVYDLTENIRSLSQRITKNLMASAD